MTRRQRADLHVHTAASDGTLTPEQAVQEADRIGLAAIGITDHDTIGGVTPGLAAGERCGLMVVPAVEINTDLEEDEIHILGYYINHQSAELNARLDDLRAKRAERAGRIVQKLNELGLRVSLERVKQIAGGGSIGRPHIARTIVEAGYVKSIGGAFGKYLTRGAPAYVPRHKLTPFQAIGIVHEAGGVAVFAHPGLTKHQELIPELVDAGLQGIEVYHTDHSSAQAARFNELARRYGLVATGGSDSHGPDNIKTVPIGQVTVDMSVVAKLQELARGFKGSRG